MIVRRYLGKDIREATQRVKMDMGDEAVIISTRKVRRKGFMGIFSKPLVEISAAIDDYAINKKENHAKRHNEINREKNNIIEKQKEDKIEQLENKLSKMEGMLEKVCEQIREATLPKPEVKNQANALMQAQAQARAKEQVNNEPGNRVIDLFYNNLLKNEVDSEIAKEIMDDVKNKLGSTLNINDIANGTYTKISDILGKPETIKLRNDGKPTVVLFIGPTGVGKTTTIAKLAADFLLKQNKKVGLITADTYRIAAIQQLKTYAEILGVPVGVAYNIEEIKTIIEDFSDKDVILIDTAGRSTKHKEQFDELRKTVSGVNSDEVFLVLSSTTSLKSVKDIIQNYCFMDNYKVIFTKLDETPVRGIILNVRKYTKKSISYVTTGQEVPEDFNVASVEEITKFLLGSISK